MGAVLRVDPVGAVHKGRFAMEIDLMVATAAVTNSGIIYWFNNFLRTKFLDPTVPAERIMV